MVRGCRRLDKVMDLDTYDARCLGVVLVSILESVFLSSCCLRTAGVGSSHVYWYTEGTIHARINTYIEVRHEDYSHQHKYSLTIVDAYQTHASPSSHCSSSLSLSYYCFTLTPISLSPVVSRSLWRLLIRQSMSIITVSSASLPPATEARLQTPEHPP